MRNTPREHQDIPAEILCAGRSGMGELGFPRGALFLRIGLGYNTFLLLEWCQRKQEQTAKNGDPTGIRTPITAVKGQCPNH